MESKWKRYKRYIRYSFQAGTEKLRGLDFTMRDKRLLKETGGVLHGYSKTDDAHVRAVCEAVLAEGGRRLLDVGCGKGAFLWQASNYPFDRLAGVEYVEELAEIARRNFKKLELADRIEIYQGDASDFEKYGDFDAIYFFNPFDKEVMERVIDKILASRKDGVLIVLHHPICAEVIERKGGQLIRRLYDKVKSYETYIYLYN